MTNSIVLQILHGRSNKHETSNFEVAYRNIIINGLWVTDDEQSQITKGTLPPALIRSVRKFLSFFYSSQRMLQRRQHAFRSECFEQRFLQIIKDDDEFTTF